MAKGAQNQQTKNDIEKTDVLVKKTSLKDKLELHYTDEVVFALCGPIGSPIKDVALRLSKLLQSDYGYTDCHIIKLGDYIPSLGMRLDGTKIKIEKNNPFEELVQKIKIGNQLRKKFGGSYLAEFAVDKIRNLRNKINPKEVGEVMPIAGLEVIGQKLEKIVERPNKKIAYIIDSIKNQEELNLLKLVYRDMLYFIGVFSPLEDRKHYLKKSIVSNKEKDIDQLIDLDSGIEKYEITVKDTFPLADFFIRVHNRNFDSINKKLKRFLNLIFDKEIVVPTKKETAMYLAYSAAKNSACLSRQVGAALTDEKGEIISVGWNDVPKFGGDLYKSTLTNYDAINNKDHRCMFVEHGYCFNDSEKNLLADQIYKELNDNGLLANPNKLNLQALKSKFSEDVQKELTDFPKIVKHILGNSRIRGLVEFSRSIHAEMHALIIGSQLAGTRVQGGRLFITTYPCHNCARHIIVAGIKHVYYIEPYSKSLTTKLHFDSITEDENDDTKVRILLFEGVGPNRYLELFDMSPQRKLKGKGNMELKSKFPGKPKTTIATESVNTLEAVVAQHFTDHSH
jgi:deoxycytidylate deaminase